VVAWLALNGWPVDRLAARQTAEIQAGRRWPAVIPRECRGGRSPAQVAGGVADVVRRLGLDHAPAALRCAGTPLDEGDRRLLAERPPHHGAVG